MEYSVVYNQRYFAIVDDSLASKINKISYSNRVWSLEKEDNWDDVIEDFHQKNKRYVVIDEEDLEEILEYFG
ncbi:hypothetical protein AB3329_01750 [Streptococcus sp. H31]|uniref:hypothetical protein n=1 Tax=Streptococcus huangxiaojuni TaxID=3237239 RepID=UPI0034A46B48